MTAPVVVTIGYEGKSLDDLVQLLHGEDVEVLVDVRLNAMSRKVGFSKRRLGEGLAAAGIDYVHEPRLGNPPGNRPGFAAGDAASRDAYVARLLGESRPAYDGLVRIALEHAVALLCYEGDHRTCHRTCITDQMRTDVAGLTVVNL